MSGNGIVGYKVVMRRDGIDNDHLDPLIVSNYQFSINLFASVHGFLYGRSHLEVTIGE